jgi:hypothetical protein
VLCIGSHAVRKLKVPLTSPDNVAPSFVGNVSPLFFISAALADCSLKLPASVEAHRGESPFALFNAMS